MYDVETHTPRTCHQPWTSTTPPFFQKTIAREILNDIPHCLDSIFFFHFYLHFTTKLNFKLLIEFYAYSVNFFGFILRLTTTTVQIRKRWVSKIGFEQVPTEFVFLPAQAQKESWMSIGFEPSR